MMRSPRQGGALVPFHPILCKRNGGEILSQITRPCMEGKDQRKRRVGSHSILLLNFGLN